MCVYVSVDLFSTGQLPQMGHGNLIKKERKKERKREIESERGEQSKKIEISIVPIYPQSHSHF